MLDGVLCYEYNLFIIQRTQIRAKDKLPTGKVKIEVETKYAVPETRWSTRYHAEGKR